MKDVSLTPLLHRQAAAPENGKHQLIFGKHLSLEALHSSLPGGVHKMLQDKRRNAAP